MRLFLSIEIFITIMKIFESRSKDKLYITSLLTNWEHCSPSSNEGSTLLTPRRERRDPVKNTQEEVIGSMGEAPKEIKPHVTGQGYIGTNTPTEYHYPIPSPVRRGAYVSSHVDTCQWRPEYVLAPYTISEIFITLCIFPGYLQIWLSIMSFLVFTPASVPTPPLFTEEFQGFRETKFQFRTK